jgi:plastocyanin
MKRILTSSLLAFLISFGLNAQDMIITGVFDGPLSGGTPKVVEFFVINNITDLSVYGFGSANNGGGTDGVEYTFPAQSATAGTFLYLSTTTIEFNTYFGFNPDFVDGSAAINGDDAVELFMNATAVDVFGDINVDGSGTAWDYLDGWAYRNDMGTISTTFTVADWTYSGVDATDGETSNATAVSMFPLGTYQHTGGSTVTVHNITVGGGANAFSPSSITIPQGDSIVWTNAGGNHNVNGTTTTYPANPVGFTSGSASSTAWIYGFKFDVPGSYTYQCDPHAGGGMIGTITVTSTMVTAPEVAFMGSSMTVDENVGTVNIDLMIINADANATSIDVSVGAASTATNGADYTFTSPTTVTFAGGSSANQMISVPITDDMLMEGTETIVLTLSNPTNSATLGTATTYTITINASDAVVSAYSIGTVTAVNADGVADSLGVLCEITGIVHGVDMQGTASISFTIIDATGGIGLFNSTDLGYTVMEGDEVTVKGTIEQFNGLTQINPDSITLNSSGNATVTPLLVTTLDETTESELVQITGLTLVDPASWNATGASFNADFTDGTNTYSIRIDSDVNIAGTTPFVLATDVVKITGIGGQFDNSSPYTSGYQLFPRYSTDIEILTNTKNQLSESIKFYPNPVNNIFVIETAEMIETVRITNALGQVVKTLNNVNGTTTVNVETLPQGMYFVTFTSENNSFTQQMVKQ